MACTRVLVVDDQPIVARSLAAMVEKAGHASVTCHNVEDALRQFEAQAFDAVLSDVKMGVLGGFDLLLRIRERAPLVPVVLITGEATVSAAMDAMDAGAYDYLSKPVRPEALSQLLARAIEHKRLQEADEGSRVPEPAPTEYIIGHSPLMLQAFMRVARAAPGNANVLILGENGTGKEMVAKVLHDKSERAKRPFVAVNVGAIASGVAESELFGHRRGAFTDARENRTGLFEQAHGGTLFLDEIGDLELGLQVKLLRAIQERRIKPVGGNEEVEVDIRLVSATNRDLLQHVRDGRFREDLYYRINVVSISLPPLRERVEDIPELSAFFLSRFATRSGRRVPRLSEQAQLLLQNYPWPGNVRELENVMQRAVQFCMSGIVSPEHLMLGEAASAAAPTRKPSAEFATLREKMDEYVEEVIRSTGGNYTQAAKILGIARRTLQRMSARRRPLAEAGDNLTHRAPN